MLKKIDFKYGKKNWAIGVPKTCKQLNIQEPDQPPDHKMIIRQFETDFSKALPKTFSNGTKISVVVADKTRLCEYATFLPILIKVLDTKKITSANITFFIAYGTHARQNDTECLAVYGDTFRSCRFVHHDSNNKGLFTRMGTTQSKTQVHIRKDLLDSDLIITFGALSHHYFAGYGGGRKLLFPGLGYKEDIYKNHSLFLDQTARQLSLGCQPGKLDNNPLAMDLKEIDDFNTISRVCVHGILNSKGKVCRLIVGNTYGDFLNACTILDTFYRASEPRQYQLVVASCGGFPKDINLIQAHKAINNAAMFVKDGGTLIVLAQCSDGVGSDTFLSYFEYGCFDKAFSVLKNDYKGNGGTALSMMTKTQRINIFLKTDLDDKICNIIGVKKLNNALIEQLINKEQYDAACIENAGLLIR
ncbi:MAG: lactate racemase domain-containing protein [Pseudomonadota bacterium]